MKYTVILLLVFWVGQVHAKNKEYVSDYLKRTISPGLFIGRSIDGQECLVQVSHNPNPTSTNKLFEVKIMDEIRMNHVIYALNDKLTTGGRGECPVVRHMDGGAILINNRAAEAPCFGNRKRVNFGMLLYKRLQRERTYSILNPDGEVIKKCLVRL